MNNLFFILLMVLNFGICLVGVYPMDKILTKAGYYSGVLYSMMLKSIELFISGLKILIDNLN